MHSMLCGLYTNDLDPCMPFNRLERYFTHGLGPLSQLQKPEWTKFEDYLSMARYCIYSRVCVRWTWMYNVLRFTKLRIGTSRYIGSPQPVTIPLAMWQVVLPFAVCILHYASTPYYFSVAAECNLTSGQLLLLWVFRHPSLRTLLHMM